jgi:hypothetical protein
MRVPPVWGDEPRQDGVIVARVQENVTRLGIEFFADIALGLVVGAGDDSALAERAIGGAVDLDAGRIGDDLDRGEVIAMVEK